MPKLKSLRGAIGVYGRVAAGGIIEVDDPTAKTLLQTKRFAVATDADITAAQARLDADLKARVIGAAPGFSAMPQMEAISDDTSFDDDDDLTITLVDDAETGVAPALAADDTPPAVDASSSADAPPADDATDDDTPPLRKGRQAAKS